MTVLTIFTERGKRIFYRYFRLDFFFFLGYFVINNVREYKGDKDTAGSSRLLSLPSPKLFVPIYIYEFDNLLNNLRTYVNPDYL